MFWFNMCICIRTVPPQSMLVFLAPKLKCIISNVCVRTRGSWLHLQFPAGEVMFLSSTWWAKVEGGGLSGGMVVRGRRDILGGCQI